MTAPRAVDIVAGLSAYGAEGLTSVMARRGWLIYQALHTPGSTMPIMANRVIMLGQMSPGPMARGEIICAPLTIPLRQYLLTRYNPYFSDALVMPQ